MNKSNPENETKTGDKQLRQLTIQDWVSDSGLKQRVRNTEDLHRWQVRAQSTCRELGPVGGPGRSTSCPGRHQKQVGGIDGSTVLRLFYSCCFLFGSSISFCILQHWSDNYLFFFPLPPMDP